MVDTVNPPTPVVPQISVTPPGQPASWRKRLGSLGGRTLTVLAILALLVAAADRSGWFSDWSADRRFTLSPRLVQLIQQQKEPIELVALWGADAQTALAPLESMLQRMGTISPTVTYRRIDPELQKPVMEKFREKYHDAQPFTLYVTRGERVFAIGITGYTRLVLQREVGGALVTLAEEKLPLAYVFQGHGELRPGGGAENGGQLLLDSLSLAGFQVQTIDGTTTQDPSPDGILVIAGPTSPLGARDLKRIDQHLIDGGGLLVLADDKAPNDLIWWLRRHGVFVGGKTIPDPASEAPNPAKIVVTLEHFFKGQEAIFPNHRLLIDGALLNPEQAVTKVLAQGGVALLSPWTAPVMVIQPVSSNQEANAALASIYEKLETQPFTGQPLFRTEPSDAWEKPRAAPLEAPADLAQLPSIPLAWAVEYQPHKKSALANIGGRLVVWGSRSALSDGILTQANFANDQFLRQAAAWLARRTAATDIPEAEVAAFQVNASDNALFLILGGLLAVIPCLCLGLAMLTWWDRR